MPNSGLHCWTHWQGFFRNNSEAESHYWPCRTLQKLSRKRRVAEKSQETWDPAFLPVQSWFGHFGQRLANPLGFDFLAWEMGEQHLSANLSGFGKSNKIRKCALTAQCPVQMLRDDSDVASRKLFYLCVLRSSIHKGSPISLPVSQPLRWRVQNHSRGSSWGLPALLLILPS